MPRRTRIDVFEYRDFRAFLSDLYAAKKRDGGTFSFRAFSRRANLRAPNHLKRVIDGDRRLTPEMALRYSEALNLDSDEARYFCDLVAFNQASTQAEKNAAYARLTGHRGYRRAHKLDLEHAAYHASWFIPAIREMAARPDFQADPDWIAGRMRPAITRADAARALETLFELGLLARLPDGRVVQGEAVLSTGPETRGLHIVNYHHAMLRQAADAIEQVPAAERDISSLTMCVGEEGLRRIKERIQRFRQELLALCADESDGDQVVQLGIQLFPLTTSRSEESQ